MKHLFWIACLCCSPALLFAQHYEVGLWIGGSNYQGEFSQPVVVMQETHVAFGALLRYYPSPFFAVRANLSRATISGTDENSTIEERKMRNLSFRSNVWEFAVLPEWHILGAQPFGYERMFSPYVFAGVAVFSHNPEAYYDNRWIPLQPLGTEGQSMPGRGPKYQLTQVSIPMGAGIKYSINEEWNIGLEFGMRKTFTDYLDDIGGTYVNRFDLIEANGDLAGDLGNRTGEYLGTEPVIVPTGTQRGNEKTSDWYMMGGITISYNFTDIGGGRGNGCPNNF